MASNPPPQVQKLFGSGKTLIVGVNSVGGIYYRNENSNFQNLVGLAKYMSVGPLGNWLKKKYEKKRNSSRFAESVFEPLRDLGKCVSLRNASLGLMLHLGQVT